MSIQRILVVDDDSLSREFLVEAIAALGYQPIAAKNGQSPMRPRSMCSTHAPLG